MAKQKIQVKPRTLTITVECCQKCPFNISQSDYDHTGDSYTWDQCVLAHSSIYMKDLKSFPDFCPMKEIE